MFGVGFWQGAVLGLGAAIPIGPVNLEIIRRGLAGGFWPALSLGLGAASADTCYVLLIMAGVGRFAQGRAVHLVLALFSACFLGLLALRSLNAARKYRRSATAVSAAVPTSDATPTTGRPSAQATAHPLRGYATGLAMTLTNPYNIGFWLSVSGATSAHAGSWLSVAAGVIAGTVSWVVGLSAALHSGRALTRPSTLRVVDLSSGIVMLAFALQAAAALVVAA